MPDLNYREFPFIFASKGIMARLVTDTASPQEFQNLENMEELAENAFAQRLGNVILNGSGVLGGPANPLSSTVVSVAKLGGLAGAAWRYAVTADGKLWRRSGITPGAFTQIGSGFSGNPCSIQVYRPDISAYPYAFFGDSLGMFKDNGSLAAPQQMGIFRPQVPVIAAVQPGDVLTLDNYTASAGSYTYTGIGSGTISNYVNTTTTAAILVGGVQEVTVADPTQLNQFQLLTIGGSQTVLVLKVTANGFIANVAPAANGSTVTAASMSVAVPPQTTATFSWTFGGKPIGGWPSTLSQSDYIGIMLYVNDPTLVNSITVKLDCGDGSYNTDYFYKVIAQGPQQGLLASSTDPATAATDAVLADSLGLYANSSAGIGELNQGLNVWTPLLFQLSDFSAAGRADFNDPVFNWANVNGYQVKIVTNSQSTATVQAAALILFGGSGPDTLGGVAYDYMFTFYNANDGTESNPSPAMTNVSPPNSTYWAYPRRQPVQLTMQWVTPTDPQVTHLRIYRRGGTLGDNYRRVDQVVLTGNGLQTYTDTVSDASLSSSDIISFTNDVPVSSVLPVPVNTTLTASLSASINGAAQPVAVASAANISVGQLVTIGNPTATANNFETVIVQAPITGTSFYASVQNSHSSGESVQATEKVGQPCPIMAIAYGQFWFAGDPNNPNLLYYGTNSSKTVEVSTPDDPITAIVPFKGNLYVSTLKGWWAVAPGSNASGTPTVYPTACKQGCVATFGWVATEEAIWYQAIDGIRVFAGGASTYLTQELEFIFQGIGSTPIVKANQNSLAVTVMAYWNNLVYVSYLGVDGKRHRLAYHRIYKRWRNDDVDAQCMILETDTNTLVFGDASGYVHADRQPIFYDQGVSGGVIAQTPIAVNLQSSYQNQGAPEKQKQYNNFQVDCATGGQDLTLTLLFDDGQSSIVLGTVNTSQRQKVNFQVNAGKGQQAYKVALQITGNLTAAAYVYQCSIEALVLPMTRRSFDTYDMNLGGTDSKFAKELFLQYTAAAAITVNVYYDSSSTPGFTFTVPANNGIRNPLRQRLPAIQFRTIRVVGTSTADFMLWEDSCIWSKFLCQGRGYEKAPLTVN